jgi:hypothetical protein
MIASERRKNGIFYQLKGAKSHCFMTQINESWIWHRRICHIIFDSLVRINSIQAIRDLPKITKLINFVYKECQVGKQVRRIFKVTEKSTTILLELIHIDLHGPTRVISLQGDRYFMLLIDDYFRITWVTFIKEK